MSGYYIEVGHTIAAAFTTRRELFRALPYFAIGINVRIKKGQPVLTRLPNARRQSSTAVTRNYPLMLKPGEFKLDSELNS
jgi:hypothetical protein